MATRNAFDGKRRAGNPHVWFDEGEVAQAATSRRWGPLCSFRHGLALAMVTFAAATAPAGEYYVDCNMSDYTGHDGTTPAKAYETIQQAVSCPNGSVIHVAPGRYDKGLGRDATYDENGNRTGGHWWLKSRVSITDKDLTFIADKGAGRTFIVGEHDPETGNYGRGAVRCLDVLDNGTNNKVVFRGFTFCDGATQDVNDNHPGAGGAALISNGSGGVPTVYFIDCVVSNCIGAVGIISGGVWMRCHVTHNDFVYGAIARRDVGFQSAAFLNCVFSENRHIAADGSSRTSANVSFVSGCKLVNCTVAANGCTFWGNSPIYKYNSILSACKLDGTTAGEVNNAYDSVGKFLMIAPRLGDWRVRAGSDADGTADAQYLAQSVVQLPEELESERCVDFYGRPYDTSSPFMMGAVQESAAQVAGAVRFSGTNGTFGDPQYVPYVQDYAIPTTSRTNYLARPVLDEGGMVFDYVCTYSGGGAGASSTLLPSADGTLRVTPAPSSSTTLVLTVNPATGVLYADAETEEETSAQNGSAGHPFKTLRQAAEAAASWNVIIALPGTYDEGTMMAPGTTLTPRRVVLPANVMLMSRDGAAKTCIKGEASDVAPVPNNQQSGFIDGLGPHAVAGVYVAASAILRGFTVTNCYTRGVLENGSTNHGSYDTCGAAVAGSGCVYDCVLAGNAAFRGGGGKDSKFYRCLFRGNKAVYGGGATSDCWQYGCLSRDNVCNLNAYCGSFFYWQAVENCTVLDSMGGPCSSSHVLKNTLVWGSVGDCDWQNREAFTSANYANCVFADRETGYIRTAAYRDKMAAGAGCKVVSPDDIRLDGDGRPVVGANVAVDAGDVAATSYLADTDLLGGQRIYNGTIDVGALEGDWRGRYAECISRRIAVTQASPTVSERNGKVRLADMDTLAAQLVNPQAEARSFVVDAEVSGAGSLTISIDGIAVATLEEGGAGASLTLCGGRLLFAFEGPGHADIGRMTSASATLILFR